MALLNQTTNRKKIMYEAGEFEYFATLAATAIATATAKTGGYVVEFVGFDGHENLFEVRGANGEILYSEGFEFQNHYNETMINAAVAA